MSHTRLGSCQNIVSTTWSLQALNTEDETMSKELSTKNYRNLDPAFGRLDDELRRVKSAAPKFGFHQIATKSGALQVALLNVIAPEIEPIQIVLKRNYEALIRHQILIGGVAVAFRMTNRDIFDTRGRGVVVVGTTESGKVRVGGRFKVVSQTANMRVEVASIEKFNEPDLENASAGTDDVGIGLADMTREQASVGDVLIELL